MTDRDTLYTDLATVLARHGVNRFSIIVLEAAPSELLMVRGPEGLAEDVRYVEADALLCDICCKIAA